MRTLQSILNYRFCGHMVNVMNGYDPYAEDPEKGLVRGYLETRCGAC